VQKKVWGVGEQIFDAQGQNATTTASPQAGYLSGSVGIGAKEDKKTKKVTKLVLSRNSWYLTGKQK